MKKLKADEDGALDMMIDKYLPYVYTVARNFSAGRLPEEDLEEAVSDTFALLWKNRAAVREDRPVTPYLAAIVRNRVKNKLREYAGILQRESPGYEPFCDDLPERFENELLLGCIWQGVEELSEVGKELFIRYYFYGERLNAIAERMGISQSCAKTALHRARKRIKRYLTERGYDLYEENKKDV